MEQGIVSCVLIAACAAAAVLGAAPGLFRWPSGDSDSAVRDDAAELCGSALAAVTVLPICIAQMPSGGDSWQLAGAWGLSVGLSGLAIAARSLATGPSEPVPRQSVLTSRFARRAAVAAASAAVALAGSACAVGLSVRAASADAHEALPATVIRGASAIGFPVDATWRELHGDLRAACGTAAAPPASMAAQEAGAAIGRFPMLRALSSSPAGMACCGLLVDHLVSRREIAELFVAEIDRRTGHSLPVDAARFFGEPAAALSDSQAQFVVWDELVSPADSPPAAARSASAGPFPDGYACQALPRPWDASMYHGGAIDDSGAVVGSVLSPTGRISFSWRSPEPALDTAWAGRGYSIFAINDRGDCAGYDGETAIMIDRRGRVHHLSGLPGFFGSVACDIDDHGDVAGYAFGPGGTALASVTRAIVWEHGLARDLGVPPGYVASRALSVSDSGLVAGWMLDRSGHTRAMLWDPRRGMRDLGAFGTGKVSLATCVNDCGQVVGAAQHSNGLVTAFLWQGGVMHDLGLLPGDEKARAYAINDAGEVVGGSFHGDINTFAHSHAFIWDSRHGMRDLTGLIAASPAERDNLAGHMSAYAIAENGRILATFSANPLVRTLFELTPIMPRHPGGAVVK